MERKSYTILLVEDNPDDVFITKRAYKKAEINRNTVLRVVNNGKEALKFLYKEEEYNDAPTPSLILLDLNMPKIDGFRVLEKIKNDDDLKRIPVIVFTSSDQIEDIERAYKLGCNSYIEKQSKFSDFKDVMIGIKCYWFGISEIPD